MRLGEDFVPKPRAQGCPSSQLSPALSALGGCVRSPGAGTGRAAGRAALGHQHLQLQRLFTNVTIFKRAGFPLLSRSQVTHLYKGRNDPLPERGRVLEGLCALPAACPRTAAKGVPRRQVQHR